jgi:hypothetical protein
MTGGSNLIFGIAGRGFELPDWDIKLKKGALRGTDVG